MLAEVRCREGLDAGEPWRREADPGRLAPAHRDNGEAGRAEAVSRDARTLAEGRATTLCRAPNPGDETDCTAPSDGEIRNSRG
jgi:hypothetical protein